MTVEAPPIEGIKNTLSPRVTKNDSAFTGSTSSQLKNKSGSRLKPSRFAGGYTTPPWNKGRWGIGKEAIYLLAPQKEHTAGIKERVAGLQTGQRPGPAGLSSEAGQERFSDGLVSCITRTGTITVLLRTGSGQAGSFLKARTHLLTQNRLCQSQSDLGFDPATVSRMDVEYQNGQ